MDATSGYIKSLYGRLLGRTHIPSVNGGLLKTSLPSTIFLPLCGGYYSIKFLLRHGRKHYNGLATLAFTIALFKYWIYPFLPSAWCARVRTWLGTYTGRLITNDYRGIFRGMTIKPFERENEEHPHCALANERIAGRNFMKDLAVQCKLQPFDVSKNCHPRPGNRFYYCVTDHKLAPAYTMIPNDALVILCDVDYYIEDMEYYAPHPIVLFTRCPDTLGRSYEGGGYTVTEEGTLIEQVLGGSTYTSPVWSYDEDHVIIRGWLNCWLYGIDRKKMPGSDRYIVLLTPLYRFNGPHLVFSKLWRWTGISENAGPLCRRKVVRSGGFISASYLCQKETFISIRSITNMSNYSVNIPARVYEAIASAARTTTKRVILAGEIERIMNTMVEREYDDDGVALPIAKTKPDQTLLLTEYFQGEREDPYSVNFQTYSDHDLALTLDPGRSKAVLAAHPITHPSNTGIVPVDSINNDITTVAVRVTDVKNSVEPPPQYIKWARAFSVLLIPEETKRRGCPVDQIVVEDNQSRPAQVARQESVANEVRSPNVVKAFIKGEAHPNPGRPRNISTVTPHHTMDLSRFNYAFKQDICGSESPDWWCPGKTPLQIAVLVNELCSTHQGSVIESDYSAFDGTVSKFLRGVERSLYMRWVSKTHARELAGLLKQEVNVKATTRHRISYDTGNSRLSGSPLTTEGNTLLNAFVAFCGYKLCGHTDERAFKTIGPVYGDDGIQLGSCKLQEAALAMGLVVKTDIIAKGSPVKFLGRVFVNPDTAYTSICEPLRALMKIPVRVDESRKLSDKVTGYLVTDPNTPLVGNYCRALQRVYDLPTVRPDDMRDKEMAFKIRRGPYPWDEADRPAAIAVVATLTELTVVDVATLDENLASVTTLEQLVKIVLPRVGEPTRSEGATF